MNVQPLLAPLCASLSDFLADPMDVIGLSGEAAVAILDNNKPAFYVVSPLAWERVCNNRIEKEKISDHSDLSNSVMNQGSMRSNRFDVLAEQLLDQEAVRVQRGELSAASVGILRNRLDAHVLPFFKYIPPSQVNSLMMDAFVKRLTNFKLSSTTVSQYLVVLRKLLKLAIRHGFLSEIPELPVVKAANRPRSALSLHEYAAVVRVAYSLARAGASAPEVKASTGHRERFWVAPRNLILPLDMAWAIRFMVNSFVRPGDLRQLKHKHVHPSSTPNPIFSTFCVSDLSKIKHL
jgi:hypothetical protein